MKVERCASSLATEVVIREHYLHRRPPISFAYSLTDVREVVVGVVSFGIPASRHMLIGACPTSPESVVELNRLWVSDEMATNTESWFVSRALKLLPPRIVLSYADTTRGHYGTVYRALNFHYAGWTDMERKTPRFDYIPTDPTKHAREASRSGCSEKRRRLPKIKYWTTSGTPAERRRLATICRWPSLDWNACPPPGAAASLDGAVA